MAPLRPSFAGHTIKKTHVVEGSLERPALSSVAGPDDDRGVNIRADSAKNSAKKIFTVVLEPERSDQSVHERRLLT